ncbi:hypothetical protein ACFX13_000747 [Malus domestica]
MIFARPFRDPTKRGTVRACDDHGDFAAAKVKKFVFFFEYVSEFSRSIVDLTMNLNVGTGHAILESDYDI